LLIAAGDNTSALTILEQGAETGSLKWAWLNDGVLLQALGNEPRFDAVRQEVWGQINERRNAVGWPSTDGQVAWDSGEPLQSE
jgi:anti-sigma factor RsiW